MLENTSFYILLLGGWLQEKWMGIFDGRRERWRDGWMDEGCTKDGWRCEV
jgi:hypothetical protein